MLSQGNVLAHGVDSTDVSDLDVRNTLLGETGPLPERLIGTEGIEHCMVRMASYWTQNIGQQGLDREI